MSSREKNDTRQRTIHVSRRGSIRIAEPSDLTAYLGSDQSLGLRSLPTNITLNATHSIPAASSHTSSQANSHVSALLESKLEMRQLESNQSNRSDNRRLPTSNQHVQRSRRDERSRPRTSTSRVNPHDTATTTSASYFEKNHHEHDLGVAMNPKSYSAIDKMLMHVDKSLDSMRLQNKMSIDSALRHMRSRLPQTLDKLGLVAFDRIATYVSETKDSNLRDSQDSTESAVLSNRLRTIQFELEDLGRQNVQRKFKLFLFLQYSPSYYHT